MPGDYSHGDMGRQLEKGHQLLTMMLDAVYVDMTQGLVLGLKPKPEFLLLFNLGEPVTKVGYREMD